MKWYHWSSAISISFFIGSLAIYFCPEAALKPNEQAFLYFILSVLFAIPLVRLIDGSGR